MCAYVKDNSLYELFKVAYLSAMVLERIDHIVLAVPNLEEGMAWLYERTGCSAVLGGVHPGRGTRNALLRIGPKQYLELLAPDESQQVHEKWMGVDLIDKPTITRWCLKSNNWIDDIEKLAMFNSELAKFGKGERRRTDGSLLSWQLSYPLARPQVELAPFLIEWGADHPCDELPMHCALEAIRLIGKQRSKYDALLDHFGFQQLSELGSMDEIQITLKSSKGLVQLVA